MKSASFLTKNRTSVKYIDMKKIKRRLKNWIDQYAYDEEILEIAKFYRIKTD